jgi:protein involved in polysaccharide export with SLBB domain
MINCRMRNFLAARLGFCLRAGFASLLLAPGFVQAQDRFSSMPPPPSSYSGGRSLLAPQAAGANNAQPRGGAAQGNSGAAAYGGNYPAALAVDAGTGSPVVLENIGPDYKLHRGDRLSFQVKEDRDPTTKIVVTDSGEVEVPYLDRRINAVGKTCGELQREVKAALERDLYVHATVQLGLDGVAPRGSKGRVYITGAIHQQGPVEIPTDESFTVSKAIIRAGNFTNFANQRKVRVLRASNPGKPIIVDVKAVMEGHPERDLELQPGDTVQVKENPFNVQF